jgi:hypothetical protein
MAAERELPVTLSLTGEKDTTGKAVLLDRPIQSRVLRAIGITLITWVGGAFLIFIPLLHWVLVPLAAVVGVVLGIVKFFDDVSLVSAEGVCPRCHEPRKFEGAGRYRPGRTVHCNGCGSQIAVTSA